MSVATEKFNSEFPLSNGNGKLKVALAYLHSSSEILPRRLNFVPAQRSNAHSISSDSLIPLNDIVSVQACPPSKEKQKSNKSPSNSKIQYDFTKSIRKNSNLEENIMEDEIILTWKGTRRIGAGLSNLGNTCFLNSVLQCLTYTPPLFYFLEDSVHQQTSCKISGFCALCALQQHVKSAISTFRGVISPTAMVKNIRNISKSFRPGRQEDAHEYLRLLLDALHLCCLPPSIAKKSSLASKSNSFFQKTFGGLLCSQVKCTVCDFASLTHDPFLDLSLEILKCESLTKALQRFTSEEILDGKNKYKCSQCSKLVRAVKCFKIEKLPPVLTIQLKRFDGIRGGKIDKKIVFNLELDVNPFLRNPNKINDSVYELYGVLVHSGYSTHSGHYFCFVKSSNGVWYVMDDSRVNEVSEQTVLSQKAYILFYIKKSNPSKSKKEMNTKDRMEKQVNANSISEKTMLRCTEKNHADVSKSDPSEIENSSKSSFAVDLTQSISSNLTTVSESKVKKSKEKLEKVKIFSEGDVLSKVKQDEVMSNLGNGMKSQQEVDTSNHINTVSKLKKLNDAKSDDTNTNRENEKEEEDDDDGKDEKEVMKRITESEKENDKLNNGDEVVKFVPFQDSSVHSNLKRRNGVDSTMSGMKKRKKSMEERDIEHDEEITIKSDKNSSQKDKGVNGKKEVKKIEERMEIGMKMVNKSICDLIHCEKEENMNELEGKEFFSSLGSSSDIKNGTNHINIKSNDVKEYNDKDVNDASELSHPNQLENEVNKQNEEEKDRGGEVDEGEEEKERNRRKEELDKYYSELSKYSCIQNNKGLKKLFLTIPRMRRYYKLIQSQNKNKHKNFIHTSSSSSSASASASASFKNSISFSLNKQKEDVNENFLKAKFIKKAHLNRKLILESLKMKKKKMEGKETMELEMEESNVSVIVKKEGKEGKEGNKEEKRVDRMIDGEKMRSDERNREREEKEKIKDRKMMKRKMEKEKGEEEGKDEYARLSKEGEKKEKEKEEREKKEGKNRRLRRAKIEKVIHFLNENLNEEKMGACVDDDNNVDVVVVDDDDDKLLIVGSGIFHTKTAHLWNDDDDGVSCDIDDKYSNDYEEEEKKERSNDEDDDDDDDDDDTLKKGNDKIFSFGRKNNESRKRDKMKKEKIGEENKQFETKNSSVKVSFKESEEEKEKKKEKEKKGVEKVKNGNVKERGKKEDRVEEIQEIKEGEREIWEKETSGKKMKNEKMKNEKEKRNGEKSENNERNEKKEKKKKEKKIIIEKGNNKNVEEKSNIQILNGSSVSNFLKSKKKEIFQDTWNDVSENQKTAKDRLKLLNSFSTKKHRYDDWDQELDKGRVKKVKLKSKDGENFNFAGKEAVHVDENPFQSYVNSKISVQSNTNKKRMKNAIKEYRRSKH